MVFVFCSSFSTRWRSVLSSLLLHTFVVPSRLPDFDEGLTVPVSEIPRNAVVVWVSHYWGGTPARPDVQGNTKAKAIYEGLAVRERERERKRLCVCATRGVRGKALLLFFLLSALVMRVLFCVGDVLATVTAGYCEAVCRRVIIV